jgi:type II secretory pathway pseudopilin PulG
MTDAGVRSRHGQAGFSLLETLIAMGILATGLLSMAGVLALGMGHLAGASASLIAREKAREAVESVHTARDTRVITWAQIRNQANGGVFLDGDQPLRTPGPDGLVNTADDTGIEEVPGPGEDKLLGTADDVRTPLSTYSRQILISELLTNGAPNATLRQVQVIVTYRVGESVRKYTLTTYISSIS